ncbi:MAG TPA: AAA family ATPase [Candidatus Limnocylindrales bacterium]|nr:AAA family ATPase [Candidatus Limnocylindrales bacterium]
MPILEIPDPALVVLVGAAGSGKSTLAARLFDADEVLSSDALREAVSGDAADQSASAMAFRILHRTLARRLGAGRLTVVDATNVRRVDRRSLLERARVAGVPAVAVVLDIDPVLIQARNASRPRVVDPTVVDRHSRAVRTTVDRGDLAAEGFLSVTILVGPGEVAGLAIVRRPAGLDRTGPDAL